ncbi:MAG TPA: metallophosphoesterase family protein [Anaerolineae bacterium]|nr:metallophosphoesterase family protein [Anaerolineae bacterium]HNU03959.1 metallophosphoesterase family protein [Anaerolineae bacterium]
MRILVISDVHANLTALDEVLADAATVEWLGQTGFDAIWSLGDIVGYGPWPNECIQRLQQFPDHLRVAGNHDWAALGRLDLEEFNREARKMAVWTQQHLDSASLSYLRSLPDQPLHQDAFTVTHASPREPIWEYINSGSIARENFAHLATPYCLVGHTHVPRLYRMAGGACTVHGPIYDRDISLAGPHSLIINPGSVGQPRDNDPRAAYALLDVEQALWRFRRVRYDVEITQAAMRKAGLPERLIARLAYGW